MGPDRPKARNFGRAPQSCQAGNADCALLASSALSSSRLLPLVSGSMNAVTRMPSTLTAAAQDSAANRPPALSKIGNRKTPMKPQGFCEIEDCAMKSTRALY